jgi:hypothetical protein
LVVDVRDAVKLLVVPTLQSPGVVVAIGYDRGPVYVVEHTPSLAITILAGSRSSPGSVDPFGESVVTIAIFRSVPAVASVVTLTGIVIVENTCPLDGVVVVVQTMAVLVLVLQFHPAPLGVLLSTTPTGRASVIRVVPDTFAGPLFFTTTV